MYIWYYSKQTISIIYLLTYRQGQVDYKTIKLKERAREVGKEDFKTLVSVKQWPIKSDNE